MKLLFAWFYTVGFASGFMFALIVLPAKAAGPEYCALWARTMTELEVKSGKTFDLMYLNGTLVFGEKEGDAASRETVLARYNEHMRKCTWMEEYDFLPLPTTADMKAWASELAAFTARDEGTAPATIGTDEWRAQCAAEYRTWDEETGTVVRTGSPERVRCPCGDEVECGT